MLQYNVELWTGYN